MPKSLLNRVYRGVRSGVRRYPREMMASLGDFRRGVPAGQALELDGGGPRLTDGLDAFINPGPLESGSGCGAVWIGHATLLVRLGGKVILTDPVFSDRIGVRVPRGLLLPDRALTLGLSRLAPPAIAVERLPKIDLILLSHAHFDHLDRPSLEQLSRGPAQGATVVTAARTGRLVPRARRDGAGGFGRVVELGWGQTTLLGGLTIEAVRPAHWGARTAFDHHRKWNAYVVTGYDQLADRLNTGGTPARRRFFFAGDTALTDSFDRIDSIDLAAFGIGAYDPWHDAHATPEQAWAMFRGMKARHFLPMHHSTFNLSDEPVDEPMQRLLKAACHEPQRVVVDRIGGIWRG